MIQVNSLSVAYQGTVRSTTHKVISDAPVTKGGGGMGFGAHELLEASLATCINMAVRMHADQNGIPLDGVTTKVGLTWPDAHTSRFEYSIEVTGKLTAEQREELEAVAARCPVRQTLSKKLVFEQVP